MKLAYILLTLALLVPLAFSAPTADSDIGFTGEAIDVAHSGADDVQNQNVPLTASEKVFVGSIKSDKYHYPSCGSAKNIHPENEIWFSSSADALSHGYVPCGRCHPP